MLVTFTGLILMALIAFVSWLNHHLLARLFQIYRYTIVKRTYIVLGLTVALIVGYGLTRHPAFVVPEHNIYQLLIYIAIIWVLGQLILLICQPLLYVAHRLLKGRKAAARPDATTLAAPQMTRRAFLHNALAITPFIAFGISSKGIYEAQAGTTIRRYSLTFPDLPPNLSGFKIGQISDTHIGPYFDLPKLETVLNLLRQEKPDLVVITGDFVDDLNLLKSAITILDDFAPTVPYGVYFCYGNHEYFRNIDFVRAELNKSRMTILNNENKLIIAGQKPFYLMGVDYPWADTARTGINVSVKRRQQYFAAALKNIPSDAFKVLIAHHPDFLLDAFKAQIPLTIAGHTHGGQVIVCGKSLISSYAYMYGLYQQTDCYGYVSSGTGHWFPFRFGCPPEIAIFTFQS